MSRHIFIINPEAGKKRGIKLKSLIEELYNNPIILFTECRGHATKLAREYSGKDTIIYSLGGDGTFNEVINGVARSEYIKDTVVAAVPCGSGNDFIKGITDIKDPIKLLEIYRKQNEKLIDLGQVNNQYFINIASMGFDAQIVYNARKYKRIPLISGELAYLISIFMTICRLKDYKAMITLDQRHVMKKRILFVTMANGQYYGGGMKPAPDAVIDDGLLDYCVVNQIKRRKVLSLLPKYIKGKHDRIDEVNTYKGKSLVVKSQKPMPINIDGEIIWGNNIEVTIKEKALRVLVP